MGVRRLTPILAVLVALSILGSTALGQTFGELDETFGAPNAERAFETPRAASSGSGELESGFFLHDQLTKLLVVLGFSAAALAIILLRRFALRRWLLVASVIVLGFVIGGMLCPISAVQNVILKASTGYLLLFLVPTVTALFVGRLFCGYVCPFGALQELLHVKKLRRVIPARWMRFLRFLPYAILAYVVARVLVTGVLTWSGTTPFKAFFTFGGTPLTYAISGLFALLSILIFRPFCRLFCPLGAWLSLLSHASSFRVRVGSDCIGCGKCDDACSFGAMDHGRGDAADCLLCGECIHACPIGSLRVSGRRSKPDSEDTRAA